MSALRALIDRVVPAQPAARSVHPTRPDLPYWRRTDGAAGLAWAALIALGYACWLLSATFLRGHGAFWLQESADLTQYIAGYNAFVREPWHWPILRITSLNAPEGTLATFLDTVPLYAALLKLVQHGPDTPMRNPYGIWLALCFTLQGVGAWWICREARVRSWLTLSVLAILLASMPALTIRIHHLSLMAHWLLLFGIAIYLRSGRLGRLSAGAWLAMIPVAFYINIYLFAMLSAIFLADVLRHRTPANTVRMAGVVVAVYGLLALTLGITMLPLAQGGDTTEWGFGYYSMNLIAPFTGGSVFEIPINLPHGGQGEGYNYLGLGVLVAAGFAWRMRRQRDPAMAQRHRPLVVLLGLLTVYAVSSTAYFGPVHVYDLKLLNLLGPLKDMFRSSGRFFWPVGYVIVVFAVLTMHRYLDRRHAIAVLLLMGVVQLADLREHHKRVRASIADVPGHAIDAAGWDAFLGTGVKDMLYYPPFRCNEKSVPGQSLLPTMLYAVRHGYTLSTGYIARAHKPCDNFVQEITARLTPQTAIVFETAAFAPGEIDRILAAVPPTRCTTIGFAHLCRPQPALQPNVQPTPQPSMQPSPSEMK